MLVGRDEERRRLAALLDGARSMRSGVLVLRGDAGAGKSMLLDNAASLAEDMAVLRVRGVESEAELPYAALHRLLRPTLDALGELPEHHARALGAALGVHDGVIGDRFLVSLALLGLLDTISDERPVLCLVDDAHWLDAASANALAFVARRLAAESVALLFAIRAGVSAAALDDLPAMWVGPLDEQAGAELLRARVGFEVHPEVCARLITATAGNPLALSELADTVDAEQLSGRRPLPDPLPLTAGVEESFLAQVRALPSATQRALLVAAADDTQTPSVIVAAGRSLGLRADVLDAAERAGIVRINATTLEFKHPLVRSAVYRSATSSQRHAAHRALADALPGRADLDRRAWHRAAATVGPDAQVAEDLERAAGRADERGAFVASATALHRAAELTADPAIRGRRLMAAAERAWRAGQSHHAQVLLDKAATTVTGTSMQAEIDHLRGMAQLSAGMSTAAYRTVRHAAEGLVESDPARALELVALAVEAASYADDAEAVVSLGRLAAGATVNRTARERFLTDVVAGTAAFFDRRPGDGVAPLTRAMDNACELNDRILLMVAGRAAFYLGDDESARRFSAAAVEAAQACGDLGVIPVAGARVGLGELLRGRWAAAAAAASEAVQLAEAISQPGLSAHGRCCLAMHAALRGHSDECVRHTDQALALAAGRPMGFIEDWVRAVLGMRHLGDDQPSAALGQLSQITHPVIVVLSSLDRIEAAHWSGDRASAAEWTAELEAYAAACRQPWAVARASHARALLKAAPEAEAAFHDALAAHRDAGRPFERARTELAFGATLRRARRRAAARAHLRTAFDLFDGLGAGAWARRAEVELRACGQTIRRRDEVSFDRLTPQEVQVAGLVAQGLSNTEVAARMFLSRRTIDFHLRNVFTKLAVTSRTELARVVSDRGGVPALSRP